VEGYGHGTTIAVRARDNVGRTYTGNTVTVQKDTDAPDEPSVALGGFEGCGSWNPTTLTASAFSDPVPSSGGSVQCSVNGGTWGSCPSNTQVAGYAHGTTIAVRARDNVGQISGGNTETVQRDEQAPTPSGSVAAVSESEIEWTSDAGTDSGPAGFKSYNWAAVGWTTPDPGNVQTFSKSGLAANTPYTYELDWEDNACNESAVGVELARWTWPVAPDVVGECGAGALDVAGGAGRGGCACGGPVVRAADRG